MNIRASGSRLGGLTPPTDKRIGDAFPIIEAVYRELDKLKYIAEHSDKFAKRDVELRANMDLQAIEWRYKDQDEWLLMITFSDLVQVDLLTFEQDLHAAVAEAQDWANHAREVTADVDKIIAETHQARDQAIAAASSTGIFRVFKTKAEAEANIVAVPVGRYIEVLTDEDYNGYRTRYEKTVNGYEFTINLDATLDQLSSTEPGKGAAMVGFKQDDTGAVPRTMEGKAQEWASVMDFGAVGDCTGTGLGTDDSLAIQKAMNWLLKGSSRRVVFPDGYRYRVAQPVLIDFGGSNLPGDIIMFGAICPDPGIGRAISIVNGWGGTYVLRVFGGGQTADYSQADPVGGDEAFFFRGVRGASIEAYGGRYAGRMLRITKAQPGEFKCSALEIRRIVTQETLGLGYSVSERIDSAVGQAFYIDTGDSAFGEIVSASCFWDKYGPEIEDTTDVTIHSLESFWRGVTGMRVRGGVSHWYHSVKLGDESQTLDLLTFESSTTRDCQNIAIDTLFTVGGKDGLVCKNIGATPGQGITVQAYHSRLNGGRGLLMQDCSEFDVTLASYADGIAAEFDGNCNNGKLTCQITASKAQAIRVGAACADIKFHGSAYNGNVNATAATPLIEVLGTNFFEFIDFTASSGVVDYLYKLAPSNFTRVIGGRVVAASGVQVFSNQPRLSYGTSGHKTEGRGIATIPSGATNVIVTHGLVKEPAVVQLTGRNQATASCYVDSITDTTFRVNVPTAVPGDSPILWRAAVDHAFQ